MSTPTPRTDAAWRAGFSSQRRELQILDECKKLERELAAEREKVKTLGSALQNLCDEQNGAPLERRRGQWQMAMDEAGLALAATEETK